MICPFIEVHDVDCVYCENGRCDDININSGNGDSWCGEMLILGRIIGGMMPGTIEWLRGQDYPSGIVQSALIEYRQKQNKKNLIGETNARRKKM